MTREEIVDFPIRIRIRNLQCHWGVRGEPDELGAELTCSRPMRPFIFLNPWQVRADFLALKPDKAKLLEFLNRTGVFVIGGGYLGTAKYWLWQSVLREMVTLTPTKWVGLASKLSRLKIEVTSVANLVSTVTFELKGGNPRAELTLPTTLGGMLASIYIDKMRGAKFGVCARPDCRQVFKIEGNYKRKYHEWSCGHIEAVRRNRRKAKKSKKGG